MLRRNVLIDMGPRVNRTGSDLIETPDLYKLINSEGKIVAVAPQCRLVRQDQIGSRCIMGIVRNIEDRIPPQQAEKFGLNKHWHFLIHEKYVQCELKE